MVEYIQELDKRKVHHWPLSAEAQAAQATVEVSLLFQFPRGRQHHWIAEAGRMEDDINTHQHKIHIHTWLLHQWPLTLVGEVAEMAEVDAVEAK